MQFFVEKLSDMQYILTIDARISSENSNVLGGTMQYKPLIKIKQIAPEGAHTLVHQEQGFYASNGAFNFYRTSLSGCSPDAKARQSALTPFRGEAGAFLTLHAGDRDEPRRNRRCYRKRDRRNSR